MPPLLETASVTSACRGVERERERERERRVKRGEEVPAPTVTAQREFALKPGEANQKRRERGNRRQNDVK